VKRQRKPYVPRPGSKAEKAVAVILEQPGRLFTTHELAIELGVTTRHINGLLHWPLVAGNVVRVKLFGRVFIGSPGSEKEPDDDQIDQFPIRQRIVPASHCAVAVSDAALSARSVFTWRPGAEPERKSA